MQKQYRLEHRQVMGTECTHNSKRREASTSLFFFRCAIMCDLVVIMLNPVKIDVMNY